MRHLEKFETYNEDTSGGGGYTGGVAFATLANGSGMGPVISSQPSAILGDAKGATTGSGDIGAGWSKAKQVNSLRNDFQTKNRKNPTADLYGSSKRRAGKLTRGLKKGKHQDGLFGTDLNKKKKGVIKSFNAFSTGHNKRVP